jgi:hypothetical protein
MKGCCYYRADLCSTAKLWMHRIVLILSYLHNRAHAKAVFFGTI